MRSILMAALVAAVLSTTTPLVQSLGAADSNDAAIHRIEVIVENGRVRARNEAGEWLDVPGHPAVVVNWMRQESVVWYCKTNDFQVKLNSGNPFYRDFPAESSPSGRMVSSGPPKPGSYGGKEYKFSIAVAGMRELDPHFIVEP